MPTHSRWMCLPGAEPAEAIAAAEPAKTIEHYETLGTRRIESGRRWLAVGPRRKVVGDEHPAVSELPGDLSDGIDCTPGRLVGRRISADVKTPQQLIHTETDHLILVIALRADGDVRVGRLRS